MSNQYIKIVKAKLDPEDNEQRSYPVRYDGKSGYLALSKRKLLFLEERGIFSKSYTVVLDLPYDNVDNISTEADKNLIITETKGQQHTFISDEVSPSTIESFLRELVEALAHTITA